MDKNMRDYKPIVNQAAFFAKLYPVKVPCPAYFNYYIRRLLEALDLPLPLAYDWLPTALEDFAQIEHLGDLGHYLHTVREHLVHELGTPDTLQAMADSPAPLADFAQKDIVASAAGKRLGRIDLASANYSALRTVRPDLPSSWEAYCDKLTLPKAISRSKSFRQSVLGHLNPKWQQRVQARAIAKTITSLESHIPYFRQKLVRCSPDEIVFAVESPFEEMVSYQAATLCELPARFELFELQRLSFAKAFTWTSLRVDIADGRVLIGLPKSLQPFMLPANRFYLWLTRVVYQQLVQDERDITYLEDGQPARWAFDYNRAPVHWSGPQIGQGS